MTAVLNADLRSESAIAPFKEADCRIYESILEYIQSKGGDYDTKIFYTRDREDFDDEMIYAELEDVEVELYFDAGAAVERVYEVLV